MFRQLLFMRQQFPSQQFASQQFGNKETPAVLVPHGLIRPVIPELDTIRGIAVLGVFLLHAFSWQYGGLQFGALGQFFLALTQPGWIGVNLFFVLSGFLITGILLDSKGHPHFYRRFYTRRALRILPAYYSLLLLLLLLHSSSFGFVGLSFVYLANVTDLFGVACGYGPLWSLAVEEHFYIFWPAVVHKLTRTRLAAVSAGIVVFVPTLRAVCFTLGWGKDGLAWYTWFVADGLAAGSLLAIVLRTALRRERVELLCALLLSSGLLMGILGRPFGITTRERLLGAALQHTIVNIFFAGVLLLFLLVGTSSWKRYVNNSLLRFFGYISYGLYLNHILAFRMYDRICLRYWPWLLPSNEHFELVVLKFVVAGGCAVAAAYLSRKYFEERFLRLKDRLAQNADTKLPAWTAPQVSPLQNFLLPE
ncbi:MAG TPA: acyltransferase [Terriglobales bacterium]|nr:acyltransferase [Terriglobales bacterium]